MLNLFCVNRVCLFRSSLVWFYLEKKDQIKTQFRRRRSKSHLDTDQWRVAHSEDSCVVGLNRISGSLGCIYYKIDFSSLLFSCGLRTKVLHFLQHKEFFLLKNPLHPWVSKILQQRYLISFVFARDIKDILLTNSIQSVLLMKRNR